MFNFLNVFIPAGYTKDDICFLLDNANRQTLFKETPIKVVYSTSTNPRIGSVFVKKWTEHGSLRCIKNFVRGGNRAAREARNFVLLRDAGIGVPEVFSFGEYTDSSKNGSISFIITKRLNNITTLSEIIIKFHNGELSVAFLLRCIDSIVDTVARMHAAGFSHHDLHGKNILVGSLTNGNIPIFFLDSLAVQTKGSVLFSPLLDIAKFVFWMTNDPDGINLSSDQIDYLIMRYTLARKPGSLPRDAFIFRQLLFTTALFIRRTYRTTVTIRNIQ